MDTSHILILYFSMKCRYYQGNKGLTFFSIILTRLEEFWVTPTAHLNVPPGAILLTWQKVSFVWTSELYLFTQPLFVQNLAEQGT